MELEGKQPLIVWRKKNRDADVWNQRDSTSFSGAVCFGNAHPKKRTSNEGDLVRTTRIPIECKFPELPLCLIGEHGHK